MTPTLTVDAGSIQPLDQPSRYKGLHRAEARKSWHVATMRVLCCKLKDLASEGPRTVATEGVSLLHPDAAE